MAGLASLVKFTVCGPGKFLLLPKLGASASKPYHFNRAYNARVGQGCRLLNVCCPLGMDRCWVSVGL